MSDPPSQPVSGASMPVSQGSDNLYIASGMTAEELVGKDALQHLNKQDLEVEYAKKRRALADEAEQVMEALSVELLGELGQVMAQMFPLACRACDAPMAYHHTSPFGGERWCCDGCGHGFDDAVFACSRTPLQCANTFCTPCFRAKFKPKLPTPPPTPPPSTPAASTALPPTPLETPAREPTPPPSPPLPPAAPEPVKKKKKKKKAAPPPPPSPPPQDPAAVTGFLADEAACRVRLESACLEGYQPLHALHAMTRREVAAARAEAAKAQDRRDEALAGARAAVALVETGWNAAKADTAAASYEGCADEAEMAAYAARVERWYREKEGDVVDELLENLRYPAAGEGGLEVLRATATALHDKDAVVAEYGGVLAELLCLRQYTQKPIDLDRDVLYPDVPCTKEQYPPYEARHSDWNWDDDTKRNGSIFGPVCSALRDQGPGGKQEAWSEKVLKRWIKWLCTVAASCSTPTTEAYTVYRGLGGGCLPGAVVETHRGLEGRLLGWPALSSTSFDQQASYEYMMGQAVNSTSTPNEEKPGTILFKIRGVRAGRMLQTLSQYPEEAELLLGPFNQFRVDSVRSDANNPFRNAQGQSMGLIVEATSLGAVDTADFHRLVREDVASASRRLQSKARSEKIEIVRTILVALGGPGADTRVLGHGGEAALEGLKGDPAAFGRLVARLVQEERRTEPGAASAAATAAAAAGESAVHDFVRGFGGSAAAPPAGVSSYDLGRHMKREMHVLSRRLESSQAKRAELERKLKAAQAAIVRTCDDMTDASLGETQRTEQPQPQPLPLSQPQPQPQPQSQRPASFASFSSPRPELQPYLSFLSRTSGPGTTVSPPASPDGRLPGTACAAFTHPAASPPHTRGPVHAASSPPGSGARVGRSAGVSEARVGGGTDAVECIDPSLLLLHTRKKPQVGGLARFIGGGVLPSSGAIIPAKTRADGTASSQEATLLDGDVLRLLDVRYPAQRGEVATLLVQKASNPDQPSFLLSFDDVVVL